MPAANWPKLENKRNSAERNVEDAREGNTPVYEELFAARIMPSISAGPNRFSASDIKDISLFMRIRMHRRCLKQKLSTERLSHGTFSAVLRKLTPKNPTRKTAMAEIFAILRILL